MKLKPGFRDEYRRRHDEIWPEMVEILKREGVGNFSIFYDEETDILFSYQEQTGDNSSQDLGDNDVVKKWWKYMADIMDTNPDNSPVSTGLEEVFFLK